MDGSAVEEFYIDLVLKSIIARSQQRYIRCVTNSAEFYRFWLKLCT